MAMFPAMPVNAVARQVGEHDTRLWRVLHDYVEQARADSDASAVTRVAIDETAARRGHDYITLFVDIDQARVVFATDGKDAETVAAFADDLAEHGGDPDAVDQVCIDMRPAFITGTAESLPKAAVTFDKFHAVKIVNDAVDRVRRAEQKSRPCDAHPLPLAAQSNQPVQPPTGGTGEPSDAPSQDGTGLSDPARLPGALRSISLEAGANYLKAWYFWATHSRLDPMIEAARTVKRHWDGILRWFDSKIANGLIEGINSLVQAAKAKARGYRSSRNLKAMVYLLAGKLDHKLPA